MVFSPLSDVFHMIKGPLPLLAFLLCICIAGCSSKYGPESYFNGGYSDFQLNDDTYQITFSGNQFTSEAKVRKYALRRAAEITKDNGAKYFLVLSNNLSVETSYYEEPTTVTTNNTSTFSGISYGDGLGLSGFGTSSGYATINPGTTHQIDEYTSFLTIKVLKGDRTQQNAFDAQTILANFQSESSQG